MFKARREKYASLAIIYLCFSVVLVSAQEDKPSKHEVSVLSPQQEKSTKHEKQIKKAQRTEAAANLPAVLWHDPGDISSFDLVNGAGGQDHAPRADAEYKFLSEDMNGTSPKFYVQDGDGVKWLVKLGPEAKPETAAARFVWAMGYFTDEDYYLDHIHVSGLPKLHRGEHFISADGIVRGTRLKRQGKFSKRIANWNWFDNPFVNTKEFNGLRVMMALLNNWDLRTINNKVYNPDDKERRFVVADLGASFGATGGPTTRSKGVLKDYRNAKFIEHSDAGFVDFVMATRPIPLIAPFAPKNYEMRSRIEDITKHIPVDDARWVSQQLSQLTPQQIRDAFRTAGYSPDEVEGYAQAVEARIAALNALQ